MKFKSLFITFMISANSILFADPGEFNFQTSNKPSYITVSMSINQESGTYLYDWDAVNSRVVYKPGTYSRYYADIDVPGPSGQNMQQYGSPDDNNNNDVIYWGYYSFSLIFNHANGSPSKSYNFYFDLRDQNWSRGGPYYLGTGSPDTRFIISFVRTVPNDPHSQEYNITIKLRRQDSYEKTIFTDRIGGQPETGGLQKIAVNDFTIWGFYSENKSAVTPTQSEFKLPVQLFNKVEYTTYSFGNLNAVSYGSVNSGDYGLFPHTVNSTVTNGTTDTYYGSKNQHSFKWNHNLPNSSQNLYFISLNFSLPNTFDITRNATRNFKPISTLTIKNLIEGSTTSAGSVYFKNPITSNTFDLTTVPSTGFEKTDAFENLNENIPGYGFSRYSLKAVSSFTDANNITWDWLNGDFNPTTPTDLLLSGATTKIANYKGQLVSTSSNWVQNDMTNFNGKQAVLYKSQTKLWLHLENSSGTFKKEIELLCGSFRDYSVVQEGTDTYVSYVNSSNSVFVKKINSSGTVVSTSELTGTIPSTAKPKLIVGRNVYNDPQCQGAPEECPPVTAKYICVWYQDGTNIVRQYFAVGTSWMGANWYSQSFSSYLTSSTVVQSATNGQNAYLYWTNGNVLYSVQFKSWWDNVVTVANQSYLASNIFSAAGAVNNLGYLTLAYTQQRGNFSSVFTRTVYPDGNMNTESVADMTYTPNNPPTQYYYPALMTSEGSNLLLEIGKTAYYSSPWYIFWRHDGSTWKKQSWAASPVSLKKLLHGEADDYPKETAISSLYKLDVAPVTTLGALNKINEGIKNPSSPYFSIVAQNLTDSSSFYIDLEPSSVDSILVDTLNIWHIVMKNTSVSAELVTDLNHWGTASFTESNKTVVFSPDYETRYYYTIDPSSNSARMNKTNAGKDQEENESVSENSVSVFPNPFNPTTQIKIQIKEKSFVTIEVYNLVGQQVMSEIRNGVQGEIVVPFNGSHLSSGTYFYQVSINDKVFKGKLNLVK